MIQFSKDVTRFSPLLLDNLEKKSPEDCVNEHDNRTAKRSISRVTHQLAISSENQARGYCNTKNTKHKQHATVVWCALMMCLLVLTE